MNRREKMRNPECGARSDSKEESACQHLFRIPRSAFRNSTAFTLIEVMIAITIFSLVLTAIYSSWDLIWRASRVSQTAAAQVQRQRVAIHTIEDALTCIQSFQASMKYYSFVVNEDPPELQFTSRLPDNFPRNGKFGDLNVRQLLFTLESGPDSERDLVLRQRPILLDMDAGEQQNPLVLARFVQNFKVECWDTNVAEWTKEWEKTNSIPPLIRVSLVLGGNNNAFGNAAPTLSVSRVIAVPSQTLPSVVQTGGAGPGGVNPPVVPPTAPPTAAPGGGANNPVNTGNIITH
jgi:prepilin-type N-terminal cleavage/methylation domain-containing protein